MNNVYNVYPKHVCDKEENRINVYVYLGDATPADAILLHISRLAVLSLLTTVDDTHKGKHITSLLQRPWCHNRTEVSSIASAGVASSSYTLTLILFSSFLMFVFILGVFVSRNITTKNLTKISLVLNLT